MVLVSRLFLVIISIVWYNFEINAKFCYEFYNITKILDTVAIILKPKSFSDNISCYLSITSYNFSRSYRFSNSDKNEIIKLPAHCKICYRINISDSSTNKRQCFKYAVKEYMKYYPSKYFLLTSKSIDVHYSLCDKDISKFSFQSYNPSLSYKLVMNKSVTLPYVNSYVNFKQTGFFQIWIQSMLNSNDSTVNLHSFTILDNVMSNELLISKLKIHINSTTYCQTYHLPQLYNYEWRCELRNENITFVYAYKIDTLFDGISLKKPKSNHYLKNGNWLSYEDLFSDKSFPFGIYDCSCVATIQAPYPKWNITKLFKLDIYNLNKKNKDASVSSEEEFLIHTSPIISHWILIMYMWTLLMMIIFGLICYFINAANTQKLIRNTLQTHLNITQKYKKGNVLKELYIPTNTQYLNLNARKLIDDIKTIRTMKLLKIRRKQCKKWDFELVTQLLLYNLRFSKSYSYNDLEMSIIYDPPNFTTKYSDSPHLDKNVPLGIKLKKAFKKKIKTVKRLRKSVISSMPYLKKKNSNEPIQNDQRTDTSTTTNSQHSSKTEELKLSKFVKTSEPRKSRLSMAFFGKKKDDQNPKKTSVGISNTKLKNIGSPFAFHDPIQSKNKSSTHINPMASRLSDQFENLRPRTIFSMKSDWNRHESITVNPNERSRANSMRQSLVMNPHDKSRANSTRQSLVIIPHEKSRANSTRQSLVIIPHDKSRTNSMRQSLVMNPHEKSRANSMRQSLVMNPHEKSRANSVRRQSIVINPNERSQYNNILQSIPTNLDEKSQDNDMIQPIPINLDEKTQTNSIMQSIVINPTGKSRPDSVRHSFLLNPFRKNWRKSTIKPGYQYSSVQKSPEESPFDNSLQPLALERISNNWLKSMMISNYMSEFSSVSEGKSPNPLRSKISTIRDRNSRMSSMNLSKKNYYLEESVEKSDSVESFSSLPKVTPHKIEKEKKIIRNKNPIIIGLRKGRKQKYQNSKFVYNPPKLDRADFQNDINSIFNDMSARKRSSMYQSKQN